LSLIDDIKPTLRISKMNLAFDTEVSDLIDAARQDLKLAGISSVKVDAEDNIDPLIKRAITTYTKANFGYDNPDADRLKDSYESLKNHMSLSGDYNAVP
jgi:uncharacterized phage protein (predicted DNA packaging)